MRKNKTLRRKKEYIKALRQKKKWMTVVTCLACVVVFCTVYALILPAITLEGETHCGRTEHTHSEECYAPILACALEGDENHTHTDECYESAVSCGIEEHTHTDACYINNTDDPDDEDGGGDAETVTLSEQDIDASVYEEVEHFFLWLQVKQGDTETKVYGNSQFDRLGDTTTGGTEGIEDALKYTENGEIYYLIPVSYFIGNYQSYGYTFDPENTTVCPFLYAPDAGDNTSGRTSAEYTYVEGKATGEDETSGWYVRVQDIGSYSNPSTPRSNIYYTPENSFTLTYGNDTITFYVVDGGGNPIYGDYSAYNVTAERSTKYVFGVGNAKEQTENEAGAVKEMELPAVDGYTYFGAAWDNHSVASVATTGYMNCNKWLVTDSFQFYITEPMTSGQWYSKKGNQEVYLSYGRTVEGMTPSGTVINLFDYWVTEGNEYDVVDNGNNLPSDYYNWGINEGHALKFKPAGLGGANVWTGKNGGVYPGIVANTLTDGYPALSGQKIFQVENNGELIPSSESLAYLFDPSLDVDYRKAYRNVGGLIQIDSNGYYYYDSTKNYAEYNGDSNRFTLYDDWAVTYKDNQGQFFPFDAYSTVSQSTNANSSSLNHYFGMTLTARFIQRYEGHTDASKRTDMIFDFSGDDDVWIFIDDVLVADLGGIHDAASVDINFTTGAVTVNGGVVTTIKNAFINAGQAEEGDTEGWNGNTFADETYHTLKFYYLERGSFASNLKLKYNLNSYPPTSIYKVDQYGVDVEGAGFAIYAADEDYNILKERGGEQASLTDGCYTYDSSGNIISTVEVDEDGNPAVLARALYTGTTDKKGEMVFVDADGVPYTLTELQSMFGDHFVLREIVVPDGYRMVSDMIKLRIYNGKVMVCDNTYDSGVFASASLQVAAPNSLMPVEGDIIEYVDDHSTTKGTLFAVVLKYIGERDAEGNATALTQKSSWAPIYGTAKSGLTVVDVPGDYQNDFVKACIETAKQYKESQNVFSLSASGQMLAQINGMPGDISTYYYMLREEEKGQAQYTVAYYWSSADSLKNATSKNTVRIDADAEGYMFERSFGATVAVPNLVNRLVVQKKDSEGTLINDAVFALYKVEEVPGAEGEESAIYYLADGEAGTRIFLYPDKGEMEGDEKAGDNKGIAKLEDDLSGTYEIVTDGSSGYAVGTILVSIGDMNYTITPADMGATRPKTDAGDKIGEDGTVSFANMQDGSYYLREIAAPPGYILNPAEVMVLVDDTAVYANAGTADDGVTVARGPGYVVSTLDQFASQGEIDNTLSWVYEQMLVSDVSTSFADVYDALKEDGGWEYLKSYTGSGSTAETVTTPDKSSALTTYLVYDKGGANTLFNYTVNAGRYHGDTTGVTRRMYTSVGWSYYLLYQDYDYGLEANQGGTVNYTDLRGEEISNLFSRSTFVQITDENEAGFLEISKKVENGESHTDTTPFTFTVSLKNSDGSALKGSYSYTVYDVDENGKRIPVEVDGKNIIGNISYDEENKTCSGIVTLTSGQTAVIEGIPYGTRYSVTETQNTRYRTHAVRDKEKNPIERIDGTGEKEFIDNTVTGTLYWMIKENGELDNTSTVDYINTYLDDLLIWKVDAADNNTTLAGAEFTLTKTEDGKQLYFTGTEWSDKKAVLTSNANGYIQLDIAQLGNGTYSISEVKAPNGYHLLTESISVKVEKGKFELVDNSKDFVKIGDEGLSLIIMDTGGFELPKTGGIGTGLFTIGGLLLMAGAVGYGYRMRRRCGRRGRN